MFMIIVAVLEKTDLGTTFKKSLDFVIKNIGDAIVLIIVAIVTGIIGAVITYYLGLITWIATAVGNLINGVITAIIVMAATIL